MSYTNELLKFAKKLDQCLSVQYDDVNFKYKVDLNQVVYKDKHLRQNIFGLGFTIEDASYDYIRKARGGVLIHYITDKEVEVI
jgi:hypothetical protein